MMNAPLTFPLFSGYGIELEYIIVDRESLSVLPCADRCLTAIANANDPTGNASDVANVTDVTIGGLGWSNEFVKHVIELKNRWPQILATLPNAFQEQVSEVNRLLADYGGRLMPGAMHPWMHPASETTLWDAGDTSIYDAYLRIFDCRTHGWANLQSMHINLPFTCDDDFARLHAAVRLALPILPALAASSPIADGRDTGYADYRMEVYRSNADGFPMIAGDVIPEPVVGREDHHTRVLTPMFDAIAPHDPGNVLRKEWLNSRGAIPRFDRNAIEIRIVDMQECPLADLAIAAATTALVKTLYYQDGANAEAVNQAALVEMLLDCIRNGEHATIRNPDYLALLGYNGADCSAQQLWRHLLDNRISADIPGLFIPALDVITIQGTLASRIRRALDGDTSPQRLKEVYEELCDCLQDGRQFIVV